MAATIPRYTVADLERFPDDGNRYELLDGVLLVTPAPGVPHEILVTRIAAALNQAIVGMPDSYVFTHGAVVLQPRTRLEPDVLVATVGKPLSEKWEDVKSRLLAVEVLSWASRIYDRDFKCDAYLGLGVREVWLVDRWDRTVEVARVGEPRVTMRDALSWHSARIELAELFADLD